MLVVLSFIVLLVCSVQITAFASEQVIRTAPTLSELEAMARSRIIKTRSNTGVKLKLPTKKEMLDEPFRTYTDNGKHYGSILLCRNRKLEMGIWGLLPLTLPFGLSQRQIIIISSLQVTAGSAGMVNHFFSELQRVRRSLVLTPLQVSLVLCTDA